MDALTWWNEGISRRVMGTIGLIVLAMLVRTAVGALTRRSAGDGPEQREGASARFWITQGTRLVTFVAVLAAVAWLWSGDAARFATVAGLATAGIAVALQRVITSFAAYLIVLRGRIYTVGDRITIGGVRGDVVAIGFMQTAVMEMGEPPSAKSGDPQVWVDARQYTGRIVSVSNDKIFDTPVYNYTREFPYLWEELHFGFKYDADHARAESILLDVARRHTVPVVERATPALRHLRAHYLMAEDVSLAPRVYLRITDNWVELALRFVVPVHGVRALKDAMNRDLLAAFAEARLEIASMTYEIVGLPPLHLSCTLAKE
jgi:small-conductance mechanosensitive channel